MKRFIITEDQMQMLKEANNFIGFDDDDVKEYNGGSEISNSANIHDSDGNIIYGDQPDTDDIADQLVNQNPWLPTFRRGAL